ncbi:MAG TPA: type VI secretion system contractile sheath small subunit [Polyangiaceae bacterium]|nr:type VI secretion system contractile sheath small subunit [Polyangiaceae bacterium]
MAKEGTVAPKERVNITYKPATGDAKEGVELPLKMLVLADLTGRPDERPVEERAPISIDKDNFGRVMAEQKLSVQTSVPDRLSNEANAELQVNLELRGLSDFTPDGIAGQVPELQKLLALRNALIALKGPMGNIPAFRKKIQSLLGDEAARQQLMRELGLSEG